MSRKAWNNVLIFSVLIMILLFNTTNNILTGSLDEDAPVPLLPDGAILMTLQMPDLTLERIGQGWRTSKPSALSESQLQALTQRWQTSQMVKYQEGTPKDMPLVVIAWLAGENSGRVYQLYGAGEHTLVLYEQQLFKISNVAVEQFIAAGKS
ncbi:hypothetical protein [Aliiglaciecola litoralis]